MILLDELADVVGVLDDNGLIVDDDAGHADLVLFPHLLEGVLGVAQFENIFSFPTLSQTSTKRNLMLFSSKTALAGGQSLQVGVP